MSDPNQSDLIQVVQRLSFCRDMADVMAVTRAAARDLTGADGVTVVLREGDLCHYAEENAIGPLWKGRRFPMRTCISGWCILHREQVVIEDIYADARIPHDAYRPTFVQSLAMTPIRSENPIGAIGAYWASHHRATPEELTVLQALGDSVSMAIANVQLIEKLQELNRRKDDFLSMLAHELRNPLAPIQNALHLLRLQASDPKMSERAWEIMARQVRHLSRIMDDLLDVSRLTRGKISLRRERLDLGQLIRQIGDDRRDVLEAAGLTFTVQAPETPVWAEVDATRLAQIVGNLIDNAAKFNAAHGQVILQLAADEEDSRAVIRVRDTGVGIESEVLPRIFEVFAQADSSLDRGQGGLGLGLSIAKGLVELHGGIIEASSDGAGQGAEFTIRLPREPELPALAEGAVSAQGNGRPLRILVIEDNRDAAESLRLLLEVLGHQVTTAHTGPEGIAAAKAVRPDVVLCDIGLPGMDGFAVANALRKDVQTASAHLIAVTGYGREEDRQRSLEAGFDAHLVKPVDPEKLLGHLRAS